MTDESKNASETARRVAFLRAAHHIIDAEPPLLEDPIIAPLLGSDTIALVRAHVERLQSRAARGLRSHVLLRSRYTEDSLAEAVQRGVEQYVVLGPGLDTFSYRQPEWGRNLTIIEVDHPSSQREKRKALSTAQIAVPSNVRYADIDFEHETLAAGLERNGTSMRCRTFFSWLGVTMYLTRDAIRAVLVTVASFPCGSEIILTFAQPLSEDNPTASALANQAAELGEPWLSYFTPDEIESMLRGLGFTTVTFLSRDEAMRRYYAQRHDGLLPPRRVSIVRAVV